MQTRKREVAPTHIWDRISEALHLWRTATAKEWENRHVRERDSIMLLPVEYEFAHETHNSYVRERLDLEIKSEDDYAQAHYEASHTAADGARVPKDRDFYMVVLEYCILPCINIQSDRFFKEMHLNTLKYFTRCHGDRFDIEQANRVYDRDLNVAIEQLRERWRARIEIDARKTDAAKALLAKVVVGSAELEAVGAEVAPLNMKGGSVKAKKKVRYDETALRASAQKFQKQDPRLSERAIAEAVAKEFGCSFETVRKKIK